jgi:hypothetical protein
MIPSRDKLSGPIPADCISLSDARDAVIRAAMPGWIEAESPDHKRAIIFDTQDHKVTYLSTGFRPAVTAFEACQ